MANEEILQDIQKEVSYLLEERQPLLGKWEKVNQRLEGNLGKSKNVWQSKKFIPLVRNAVQTIAYHLAGGAIDFDEISSAMPDDKLRAEIAREWIEGSWQSKWGMKDKMLRAAKMSAAYSVGWVKLPWVVETVEEGKVKKAVGKAKELIGLENKKKLTKIGVFPENIVPENVLIDPYETDFDDIDSLFHITYPTLRKLKRNKGYAMNKLMGKLKDLESSTGVDMADGMDSDYTSSSEEGISDSKRVCVIEHWTPQYVTTVAYPGSEKIDDITAPDSSGIFLRRMRNKYGMIPFEPLRIEVAERNRFYAETSVSANMNIQDGINSSVNQIFDNVSLRMSPMWMVGKLDEQKRISAAPGRIISLKEPEKATTWTHPDTTDSGHKMLDYLQFKWDVATVAGDQGRGFGRTGAKFAVEASSQLSNQDIIYDVGLRSTEEFVQRIIDKMVKIYQAEMEEVDKMGAFDTIFDMFNKWDQRYDAVRPMFDSIKASVDLNIKSGSTMRVDKNVQITRMREAITEIGRSPEAQQFDMVGLWKAFFRKAGIDEMNEYVKDETMLSSEAVMFQEKECRMMMRGLSIDPAEIDENHDIHLATLQRISESEEYETPLEEDPIVQQMFVQHGQSHEELKAQLEMEAQQRQGGQGGLPPGSEPVPKPELAAQQTNTIVHAQNQ